jgi:two-component system, chemotaxis family, protein-glutamate methylesterase/glutaminase
LAGMKILIAEDNPTSAFVLEKMLGRQGHEVVVTVDGQDAFDALQRETFDVVLTDWMMPRMDGVALIRNIKTMNRRPKVVVVTSLAGPEVSAFLLESGADGFVTKPFRPRDLLTVLENCHRREQQLESAPQELVPPWVKQALHSSIIPPCPLVCLAGNTGAPAAVSQYFKGLGGPLGASFIVILPAPVWALEMMASRLQRETGMRATLAVDGASLAGNRIYIAPRDRHLIIEPGSFKIRLIDTPLQNGCRPSVDILCDSLLRTFGSNTLLVALSGLGKDGLAGFSKLAAIGAPVLVQDPALAEASYWPQAVVDLGLCKAVQSPMELGATSQGELQAMMNAMVSWL